MSLLDPVERQAGRRCRLLFPEGDEPRVREAALRLAAGDAVEPILLAEAPLEGVEARPPGTVPDAGVYAEAYAAERACSPALASRLMARPPYLAAAMLRAGAVDALLAGVANPTRDIITACHAVLGLAAGATFPFSTFLMDVPGRGPMVFADCAVTEDPTPEQLAEIAVGAGRTAARLGLEPRVALLSFSTLGSGEHPHVEKVRQATALARLLAPDLALEGELQADAALNPTVAAAKVRGESAVAGRANVLVFPDLDAGNIGYKLVRELGGAQAFGSFLVGFGHAVCDASRGATVDDIVGTALVLARLAAPDSDRLRATEAAGVAAGMPA